MVLLIMKRLFKHSLFQLTLISFVTGGLILGTSSVSLSQSELVQPRLNRPSIEETRPKPVGQPFPPEAQTCMESSGKTYEVVGTAKENDKTFYYAHIYLYNDTFESWYSLIQVDPKNGCLRLLGSNRRITPYKPLSSFMSVATARQLELKRYQHEIKKAGGRRQFEQRLQEKLNPEPNTPYARSPIFLTEEQVWALNELGFKVSGRYTLLRSGQTPPPLGGGQ